MALYSCCTLKISSKSLQAKKYKCLQRIMLHQCIIFPYEYI